MASVEDVLLAAQLAAAGVVRAEDLARVVRERDGGGTGLPLGTLLRDQGLLTADQWDRFCGGSATASTAHPPDTAPAAAAAAATGRPTPGDAEAGARTVLAGDAGGGKEALDPVGSGRRLGRYRLQKELGRGGMGVVYLALDTELRRDVALKTLLLDAGENRTLVERLQREAQTAAALRHPGIVPIHDAGTIDGVPFLAMGFVRGQTLSHALSATPPAPLRERVRWVADAADAVAHAHDHRIIHRDVKPSNLMIDEAGGVHVLDFGLARRLEGETALTRSGEAVGTPLYMAPEQMNGERKAASPAADVYSLGAVLYEALAGQPPFPGATMGEVVARVLTEDPVPLRRIDARIPLDLDTICARALSKEPERRFPTAREFAQELVRWRNGEAITSRPESAAERWLRWGRRRKALLGVGMTALSSIVLALGFAWQEESGRRERADLAAQVTAGLRERAATLLEATLVVRRSGGMLAEAERAFAEPLRHAAAAAQDRLPELPDPHFQLGRLYRALLRFDEARAEQDRALAKDPGYVPSLYERAVLSAQAHRTRAAAVRAEIAAREALDRPAGGYRRSGAGPAAPVASADAEFERLRAALQADLARLAQAVSSPASGADLAGGRADRARLAAAQGLAAAYSGIPGEAARARERLAEALALDDSLEEAYETLADVALMRGELEAAEAACTDGMRRDRGYVPYPLVRGEVRLRRALDPSVPLDKTLALMRDAAADFQRAAELAPASVPARLGQARALTELGRHLAAHQNDPTDALQAARDAASRALESAPDDPDAWFARATAWSEWADLVETGGEDPEDAYQQGESDYGEGLRRAPDSLIGLLGRGMLRANRALYRMGQEEEPESCQAGARADFKRVLEIAPEELEAWKFLGIVHGNQAQWDHDHGQDPEPSFRAAEEHYARACSLEPAEKRPWAERGTQLLVHGLSLVAEHRPAQDRFERAVACFDEALKADPSDAAEAWEGRGQAEVFLAEARAAGGDITGAAEWFARAEADLTQALDGIEETPEPLVLRGRARAGRAFTTDDPAQRAAFLQSALGDLDQAVGADPEDLEARMHRGRLRAALGRWQEAVEDFDALARLDPDAAEERSEEHAAALLEAARADALDLARGTNAAPHAESIEAIRDRLFQRLRRAIALGLANPQAALADDAWAPLRNDPRWSELQRDAGAEDED